MLRIEAEHAPEGVIIELHFVDELQGTEQAIANGKGQMVFVEPTVYFENDFMGNTSLSQGSVALERQTPLFYFGYFFQGVGRCQASSLKIVRGIFHREWYIFYHKIHILSNVPIVFLA